MLAAVLACGRSETTDQGSQVVVAVLPFVSSAPVFLAEKRGFELESVVLLTLESVSNMVAALRGGSIDAALLPAHLAKALVGDGAAEILGWVHQETPWQVGALFTSTRALEGRPARIRARIPVDIPRSARAGERAELREIEESLWALLRDEAVDANREVVG